MYPLVETAPQHLLRKVGLQQRLSAREGHAAARGPEEGAVEQQFAERLAGLNPTADTRHRARNAGLDAPAAERADAAVDDDPSVGGGTKRTPVARPDAASTINALGGDVLQLRMGTPRFGVVAPCAPEVAPLHEQGGPDARAVVNRHALNRGDCSFHCSNLLCYCKGTPTEHTPAGEYFLHCAPFYAIPTFYLFVRRQPKPRTGSSPKPASAKRPRTPANRGSEAPKRAWQRSPEGT